MKILRLSYLAVNPRHLILAEECREGINDDRIPPAGIRIKVVPGEDFILEGEDADEFRRQLDEMFPKPGRNRGEQEAVAGTPIDPETGETLLPAGDAILEG